MAKKPNKKPTKKKPLPKKKPVKAAARKPVKAVGKKPMARQVKKAAPKGKVKKTEVKKSAGKKVVGKKLEAAKVKAVKPIPEKLVAKAGRKEKVQKNRVAEAAPVEEVPAPALEEEEAPEELVLTDAEGRRFCRVRDCDQLASVDSYCRYHYLLYWKKIQVRKKILTEGKLERYIEELTARYPDKFLDMLRKDLRSEKEFLIAIQELEIDESAIENELEEEAQTYIDEVRGMEPAGRESEEDF